MPQYPYSIAPLRNLTDEEAFALPGASPAQGSSGLTDEQFFALPAAPAHPGRQPPPAQGWGATGLTDEQAFSLPPLPGQRAAPAQQGPAQGVGVGAQNLTDEQFLALPPAPGSPQAQNQAAAAQSSHPIADNIATGVSRIPGAILGAPRAVRHLASGAIAWGLNKVDGGNRTADTVDAAFPQSPWIAGPTARQVNDTVDSSMQTADRATGQPEWQPYQPVTLAGKIGQTAITTAGAGAVDPLADASAVTATGKLWNLLRNGAAGGAAELTADKIVPNSPLAAYLAALVTHAGLGAAGTTAATAYESTLRPVINPRGAGQTMAGQRIRATDSTAAIANPSAADLASAQKGVQGATGAIGQGQDPAAAVGAMRDNLQSRFDLIKDQAAQGAKPYYDAFRAEVPTTPPELDGSGLTQRPGVNSAASSAAADVANLGQPGRVPWVDFDAAGDPSIVTDPANLAYTPDLLDRAATKLKAQAAQAREGSDNQAAAALSGASGDLTSFLDQRYPNTYPQARAKYAELMAPAAPFNNPMVAAAMNRQPASFGYQPPYTTPPANLFDQIARAKDPGAVMGQYIQAAGGDANAIVGPMREAIVGDLRNKGVIDPSTGEIDPKAYDAAIRPYMPIVSMYMPQLARQFETAKAAQGTLDTMRTQQGLAADIAQGGLRDPSTNVVTGQSLSRWLGQNRKALAGTQSPAALMRLQQIANAIGGDPAAAADGFLTETAPAYAMDRAGGAENAILGMMGSHRVLEQLVGSRLGDFRNAYSQAIERAMVDPVFARQITEAAARRPRTVPNAQAIREAIGQQALRSLDQGAISSAAVNALPGNSPQ